MKSVGLIPLHAPGLHAGADQVPIVAVHLIDQQLVRLNVAVAVMAPLANKKG